MVTDFKRLLLRRETAANMIAAGLVLADGEPCYAEDTKVVKIGDGVHTWGQLPPAGGVLAITGATAVDGVVTLTAASISDFATAVQSIVGTGGGTTGGGGGGGGTGGGTTTPVTAASNNNGTVTVTDSTPTSSVTTNGNGTVTITTGITSNGNGTATIAA